MTWAYVNEYIYHLGTWKKIFLFFGVMFVSLSIMTLVDVTFGAGGMLFNNLFIYLLGGYCYHSYLRGREDEIKKERVKEDYARLHN